MIRPLFSLAFQVPCGRLWLEKVFPKRLRPTRSISPEKERKKSVVSGTMRQFCCIELPKTWNNQRNKVFGEVARGCVILLLNSSVHIYELGVEYVIFKPTVTCITICKRQVFSRLKQLQILCKRSKAVFQRISQMCWEKLGKLFLVSRYCFMSIIFMFIL